MFYVMPSLTNNFDLLTFSFVILYSRHLIWVR
jgi:hypothetical protein